MDIKGDKEYTNKDVMDKLDGVEKLLRVIIEKEKGLKKEKLHKKLSRENFLREKHKKIFSGCK